MQIGISMGEIYIYKYSNKQSLSSIPIKETKQKKTDDRWVVLVDTRMSNEDIRQWNILLGGFFIV